MWSALHHSEDINHDDLEDENTEDEDPEIKEKWSVLLHSADEDPEDEDTKYDAESEDDAEDIIVLINTEDLEVENHDSSIINHHSIEDRYIDTTAFINADPQK